MLQLDLKALRDYDESALKAFFDMVAVNWGRPLSYEVVRALYEEGVGVHIVGSGIGSGSDVSYAFYAAKMSRTLPLRWTMRCVSAGGASHSDIIGRNTDHLLVAGSLHYGKSSGISSTWILRARTGSPEYYLGLYLNDLFLNYYHPAAAETLERMAR